MEKMEKILVIDDDDSTRKTLELILRRKGFDVVTAGTGQEALKIASEYKIVIALLDIRLPDIEGIQLIAPLKKISPRVSVIMITGHATMENAVQALNEGAAGFITKPLNINDVISKIESILEIHNLIEAKKRVEQALYSSEEKFRNLVENINDIIYSLDEWGIITYISPVVQKTSGFSPSEVIGKSFKEFIFSDDLPEVIHAFETIMQGKSITYMFRIMTDSHELRWLNCSSQPIFNNEKKIVGSQGVLTDINDLILTEDALKQAVKKLNLLSNITRHDILNQVQALMLLSDLLEEYIMDNPKSSSYFSNLKSTIATIQHQIAFTQDYQDIGMIKPEWQNVQSVIEKIIQDPLFTQINIMVSDPNISIYADLMFPRVCYNLFENAIRHGKHVSKISISFSSNDEYGLLIFQDDGIGVPDEEKFQIFNKEFGKHTGFGLFLTVEILSLTGITILETGSFGMGARFELKIPQGKYRTHIVNK